MCVHVCVCGAIVARLEYFGIGVVDRRGLVGVLEISISESSSIPNLSVTWQYQCSCRKSRPAK